MEPLFLKNFESLMSMESLSVLYTWNLVIYRTSRPYMSLPVFSKNNKCVHVQTTHQIYRKRSFHFLYKVYCHTILKLSIEHSCSKNCWRGSGLILIQLKKFHGLTPDLPRSFLTFANFFCLLLFRSYWAVSFFFFSVRFLIIQFKSCRTYFSSLLRLSFSL